MDPIQTYVFLDLETTGIPREENNKTKITELSMIAVKREHLLDTVNGKCPRVQNKLTLCFNPCKIIQPGSTLVTGLCNFLLEHEIVFNRQSFELIDTFLRLLSQPVCLVAHNGNNFDYPILKNNIQNLNVDFSCDIKCADCFFAFYDILEVKKQNLRTHFDVPSVPKKNKCMDSSREPKAKRKLVDKFTSVNLEIDENVDDENKAKTDKKNIIDNTESPPKVELYHSSNDVQEDITRQQISNNSITYTRDNTFNNLKDFDEMDYRKQIQKANESTPKRKVKRGFPWDKNFRPKESYALGNIYSRQLNREPPEAHRAENDCIMALEIAVTVSKEFVEWIDVHYTDFKDIEPMTIGVRM